MPLFRFHRGGLKESLLTTVIVKTEGELCAILQKFVIDNYGKLSGERFSIDFNTTFSLLDPRCGWYSVPVNMSFHKMDDSFTIGFLSEPF